jgi:tetratricopeptide (TPR) repeat protein
VQAVPHPPLQRRKLSRPHPGPPPPEQPAPAEEPLDDALGAEEAIALKDAGNAAFKAGDTAAALEKYAAALRSAHLTAGDRAVLWANRAAVRVRVAEWAGARKDATRALEFDPGYRKALLRRKLACERLCEWAPAAEDARALGCSPAEVAALDLRAKQKAEKETAEAVEQLKGLGNLALGAFGLSLDSFQMDKDPETGGYSVKMKQ